MKSNKFSKKVTKLVESGWESGSDGKDMAFALFKAGMDLVRDGEGSQITELIVRLNAKGVQLEWPIATQSHAAIVANFPTPSTNVEMFEALKAAGNQFLFYAAQHFAKNTPESIAKANTNVDMAENCFRVIGEPMPPTPAPFESPIPAPQAAVQSDLPFMASIDARAAAINLLRTIHEAGDEAIKPIMSLDLHGEDRFIGIMLTALGYLSVDEISDVVSLTTEGRLLAGFRPDGHMDLPVEVAEITGNIEERELAARYIDGKIGGVDRHIREGVNPQYNDSYEQVGVVLTEIAKEFRMGLHLPSVSFAGRVIPYSEDRGSGIMHSDGLSRFFDDVYQRNVKAGWWTDIKTGEPKKRNVGELMMLMVTEMSEAYNAYVGNLADDKLPQYPGLGVEMGDLLIRVADFCGALAAGNLVEHRSSVVNPGEEMFRAVCAIADDYEAIRKTPAAVGTPELGHPMPAQDVAVMVDAKLAYNATREDHKIENRLKEGGKQT